MKPVKQFFLFALITAGFSMFLIACKKHDNPYRKGVYFKVENVLDAKKLAESGTFKGAGTDPVPPVIFPGQKVSFSFSAGKGQALMFATMYGWSNDLFFAPANPGIMLFDNNSDPVEGDVSDQIKLWDNGTRINQQPGMNVMHPGDPDNKAIKEVMGTDDQGNAYLAAGKLLKATLKYDGNSVFTFTIENTSGGTQNETPFSPGVWAVSNILAGNLLSPAPFFESGKPTANGVTAIAERGDNSELWNYAGANTSILTPLSPVLIVVYNGKTNPLFKTGENDFGKGLSDIAQKGDASVLATALKNMPGVRNVYVAAAQGTTVLLPALAGNEAGQIEQKIDIKPGDKISFATMFGYSNDWFFSFGEDGVDAGTTGDLSNKVMLYDDGTAVDQFPGAGNSQAAFGGAISNNAGELNGAAPSPESKPVDEISDTYPVPAVKDIIRVSIMNKN